MKCRQDARGSRGRVDVSSRVLGTTFFFPVSEGRWHLRLGPQSVATHNFASRCLLLLSRHPELSVGNWPGSASPVGLNSEPELDPLKQPMRGGRGDWGGASMKKENFQQKSLRGRALLRYRGSGRHVLLKKVRGQQPEDGDRSWSPRALVSRRSESIEGSC